MINDAKKALAGLKVVMAIVEIVSARHPDLVEQAAEKVLGVKADVGDEVFNGILDKRAEAVTHFDKYPDRIKELETALGKIRTLSQTPLLGARYKANTTTRSDIFDVCREVLNK